MEEDFQRLSILHNFHWKLLFLFLDKRCWTIFLSTIFALTRDLWTVTRFLSGKIQKMDGLSRWTVGRFGIPGSKDGCRIFNKLNSWIWRSLFDDSFSRVKLSHGQSPVALESPFPDIHFQTFGYLLFLKKKSKKSFFFCPGDLFARSDWLKLCAIKMYQLVQSEYLKSLNEF